MCLWLTTFLEKGILSRFLLFAIIAFRVNDRSRSAYRNAGDYHSVDFFSEQRQDGKSLDFVQNQILVLLRAKSI